MGDKRTLDVISYWLAHKHGADFIVLDGGYDTQNAVDDFTDAHYFIQVARWLRHQPHGGSTLPFGWAEWYPGTVHLWGANQFNATMANAMIYTLQGGASYALMWGLEGGINGVYMAGDGQQLGLINHNQPTLWYQTVKDFYDYFGPGTPILTAKFRSNIPVTVLASARKTTPGRSSPRRGCVPHRHAGSPTAARIVRSPAWAWTPPGAAATRPGS